MAGLFKSDTYEVFKDKKEGAELVKGEAQPNVLIKCSVNLSPKLKEKDELTTDISIEDAIDGFDEMNILKHLYVKNKNYLYYDKKDKCFYKATKKTKYYSGGFSYKVDENKVTCTFVAFNKNKGNGLVKNKLFESQSAPSIKIIVANKSQWYKASDIQKSSPELYDYIINHI